MYVKQNSALVLVGVAVCLFWFVEASRWVLGAPVQAQGQTAAQIRLPRPPLPRPPQRKAVSLTFKDVKELASLAVKNNDFVFHDPVLLVTEKANRKELYVFPGSAEGFEPDDYPANQFIIQTQLRLELLRTRLFVRADDRRFVATACSAVERHLQELVSLYELERKGKSTEATDAKISLAKKNAWVTLHKSFQSWAAKREQTFRGFLQEPPQTAWAPATSNWIPFDDTVEAAGLDVLLIGPKGVEVHIIPNFKRRMYELKKIKQVEWDWGEPYQLNLTDPPEASMIVGATYYIRVRRGNLLRPPFEKRLKASEKRYIVPLPE